MSFASGICLFIADAAEIRHLFFAAPAPPLPVVPADLTTQSSGGPRGLAGWRDLSGGEIT